MTQLIEGQPQYAQGSGAKPYEMKNTGGVYSCSCPAWKNQSAKIDRRSCKHLKALLGAAAEQARIGGPAPAPAAAPRTAQTATTLPAPPDGSESAEDVLAAVFNQAGASSGRTSSSAPNEASPPRGGTVQAEFDGRVVTATVEDAQTIIDRAAAQGRKLRQDEKVKLHGPPLLLAHPYEPEVDPAGWWISEKLDGVRAYWNGTDFVSRQGNVFYAPDWFKAGMPKEFLDGELWVARGQFQKTMSVVRRQDGGEMWRDVKYVVFDMPASKAPFEQRVTDLAGIVAGANCTYLRVLEQDRCRDRAHLKQELDRIVGLKGEGLMLRKPGSLYEACRSHTLLKVKPFQDEEGTVRGYTPGKGRHKGVLGALLVELPNGKTFNIGTGLSDAERKNPPPIGSKVTFSYTELTEDGIPKCAAFVAVRDYE